MKLNHASIIAILAVLSGLAAAQTAVNLTRQVKVESGVQLPAQCSVGQLFLESDPNAGFSLYICTTANNWSGPADYNAGPGITITGSSIATEDATVPVYSTGTGAPALDCTAGRDYYVDTSAGALYYCRANGNWQALSSTGHTHTAADVTSGTFTADRLPSGVIFGNQANTYAAGERQSVSHDGNNAGLRLVPADGDPANAQDGDVWYNATTGTFRRRQNGVVSDWGGSSQTATTTPGPNAIPMANSSGVLAPGWLPQPTATTPGGVEAFTAGAHQWIKSISTAGVPSGTQPACTDLLDASASCSTDTTNASNISAGTLPAARLPAPTGSTLGGVQSKDCSGLGHVQKINTDGTVTCSADSGGSGGGTGLALSAGAGEVCLWQPCYGVSTGGTATYATNSVYYFQTVIPYTTTLKQYVGYVNPGTGSHHYVFALMDLNCNKVPGTDSNAAYAAAGYTTASTIATPPTIASGVYYLALGTDDTGAAMQGAGGNRDWQYSAFYDSPHGGGGSAPRNFTGSNPLTGSGATLAIPSSCGTPTQMSISYRPEMLIIP